MNFPQLAFYKTVMGVRAGFQRAHGALHHDFCPEANRWVYWLKNPFWVLLAAVAAGIVCGVYLNPAALVVSSALAVVLALGVAWPWVSLRGVTCRVRFLQSRGHEGEALPVEIEVENRWPWPVWGLTLQRGFACEDDDEATGLSLACVAGWSTQRVTWLFRPEVRGEYPRHSPRIENGFPFGLYQAVSEVSALNRLLVWPRGCQLDTLPDAAEIASREDRLSEFRAGHVGDVLGTRTFRQGDSLRRVHWAQSARQGQLIVCERQLPISCALRLVLDLDQEHHTTGGRDGSLNRLLRVAASIIESMHAQHARVECVIGHDLLTIDGTLSDLRRALDQLARLPATGLAPCADGGLHCATRHRSRALTEFVLTTSVGLSHLLRQAHWSGTRRYIVVGSLATPASNADCQAWLETDVTGDVLHTLPQRWRRACHAG